MGGGSDESESARAERAISPAAGHSARRLATHVHAKSRGMTCIRSDTHGRHGTRPTTLDPPRSSAASSTPLRAGARSLAWCLTPLLVLVRRVASSAGLAVAWCRFPKQPKAQTSGGAAAASARSSWYDQRRPYDDERADDTLRSTRPGTTRVGRRGLPP